MTHQFTKGLKKIRKEYQKLNHILASITGKIKNFHCTKKDWKKFEENNKTIALNILFVPHKRSKYSIQIKI